MLLVLFQASRKKLSGRCLTLELPLLLRPWPIKTRLIVRLDSLKKYCGSILLPLSVELIYTIICSAWGNLATRLNLSLKSKASHRLKFSDIKTKEVTVIDDADAVVLAVGAEAASNL